MNTLYRLSGALDRDQETLKTSERALVNIVHLCRLRTWDQFCSYALMLASNCTDRCLLTLVKEHLEKLDSMFGDEEVLAEQAGALETKAECDEFLVDHLGNAETARTGFGYLIDNWFRLRRGPMVMQLRKLMSVIVAGCTSPKEFAEAHPNFYTMLVDEVAKKKFSCFDLVDELLMLTKMSLDVATDCIRDKSFGPLCGTDQSVTSVETDLSYLKSHLTAYMLGSFEKLSEHEGSPKRDAEFLTMAESVHSRVKILHKAAKIPQERLVLARYLAEISQIQAKVLLRATTKHIRVEPIAVKLDGPTGMGKTTLMTKIMADLLKISGYPHTSEYIAFVESNSKFMDTITNATQGVIIDDALNTLVNVSKMDENNIFIKIKNNGCTPVPKAAVEEKGSTFMDVKVLLVSTNSPKLQAEDTSVEPSAVLRRFKWHILVSVRPEFQVDGADRYLGMLDSSKMTKGLGSDAHLFVLREWRPFKRYRGPNLAPGKDDGEFVAVTEPIGYSDMMEFLAPRVREHFVQQVRIVEQTLADSTAPLCVHGFTTAATCKYCQAPPIFVEEAGEDWEAQLVNFFCPTVTNSPMREQVAVVEEEPEVKPPWYKRIRLPTTNDVVEPIPEPSAMGLFKAARIGPAAFEDWFIERPTMLLTALYGLVPLFPMAFIQGFYWLMGASFGSWIMTFSAGLWTAYSISHMTVLYIRSRMAGYTLMEIRARLKKLATSYMGILAVLVVGGAGMAIMLRKQAHSFSENGGCESKPIVVVMPAPVDKKEERKVEEPKVSPAVQAPAVMSGGQVIDTLLGSSAAPRLAELDVPCGLSKPDPIAREKHWERRDIQEFPLLSGKLLTMTAAQVIDRIKRQVFAVDVEYAGSTVQTNALFICTDWVLMPLHNFMRPDKAFSEIKRLVFSLTTAHRGPYFTVAYSPTLLVGIDRDNVLESEMDMVLLQVNVGGTMCDLRDLLTDLNPRSRVPVVEMFRNIETKELDSQRYWAEPQLVASAKYGWKYDGYSYTRKSPTFKGLCGAVLVADTRYPRILALHTMGSGSSGMACRLTPLSIRSAMTRAQVRMTNSGPPVSCGNGELFGIDGEPPPQLDPLRGSSVLRTAPVGAPLMAVGTLRDFEQSRPKTQLVVSPIAEMVEQSLGIECQHEVPRKLGHVTTDIRKLQELDGLSQLPPEHLLSAMADMKEMFGRVVEQCDASDFLVPLNDVEMVTGVYGSNSLRRMPLKTAAGFPYKGKKSRYVTPAPDDFGLDAVMFTPEVMADVRRAEDIMATLSRPNFVFKGSHKDEVVKIVREPGKDPKCRVFEGGSMILTALTRKYFGPLIRLMAIAMPWLESCVGINAQGGDWHVWFQWMIAYNRLHAIEGDWRHYDTSEAYQEIMAVFSVLIYICETYGRYTQREIHIMWVIAAEIAMHFALTRGDVSLIVGTNPSGNGLTVFINNMDNGLRMRVFFYAMMPPEMRERMARGVVVPSQFFGGALGGLQVSGPAQGEGLLFSDWVRAGFYGDDFLMAAKPEILSWFNQVTMFEYFNGIGKVITAPDKGPITTEVTPWGEVSFLKRSFRECPVLGAVVGPLALPSVFKCLFHWSSRLPVAPQVHCAVLVDGVFRELLLHGEDVFNQYAPGLLQICEEFGATPYLDGDMSYLRYVADWRERQLPVIEMCVGGMEPAIAVGA